MILDIILKNDVKTTTLQRVNANVVINYDSGLEKGKTILPSQVTVYGNEAIEVYEMITSVINNTTVIIELTTETGKVNIVEGFTNINSDVVFYYEQNVVSFSVTLYNKAVNLSFVANEKILSITQIKSNKTFVISYSANQEVLVSIAVAGLSVCVLEIIEIINRVSDILVSTPNPFAIHEIGKMIPLAIRVATVIPIMLGIFEAVREVVRPNILKVDCYNLATAISDVLTAFNYNVIIEESVLDKIKNLYFIEPIQVDINDLGRGLVKKIGNERVIPTTSVIDIVEFIKHYAGARVIVKDKTVFIVDKLLGSLISYDVLNLDRVRIEKIEPNKEYNNLLVLNYAIDPSNELSLTEKTSEKVFYSYILHDNYINNTYSLNELDNGIYTYNAPFSVTAVKEKRRKVEKVFDTLTGLYNSLANACNSIIDALNSVIGAFVAFINKIIKAINKLLKTNIKTVSTPKPIGKIKLFEKVKDYIGYLQTETATFNTPIIFEGFVDVEKENAIAPSKNKKHTIQNVDKRNVITEKTKIQTPIPVKQVLDINDYWFFQFNNGFLTKKYLIDKYQINISEGVAILDIEGILVKNVLSETNII